MANKKIHLLKFINFLSIIQLCTTITIPNNQAVFFFWTWLIGDHKSKFIIKFKLAFRDLEMKKELENSKNLILNFYCLKNYTRKSLWGEVSAENFGFDFELKFSSCKYFWTLFSNLF